MNNLVTLRQEMIGDYEMGGALFTLLHTDGEMTEEFNLHDFILTYIDSDDDVMGVVVNAAFADQLAA